jgi:uncharacterized repeat protein (TIGR04076 family)
MAGRDLHVRIHRIRGRCPVYGKGDGFSIQRGYVLDDPPTGGICLHGLSALMPFYLALSRGIPPGEFGLAGPEEGCAYVNCPDPCDLTDGGTVTFRIRVESDSPERS